MLDFNYRRVIVDVDNLWAFEAVQASAFGHCLQRRTAGANRLLVRCNNRHSRFQYTSGDISLDLRIPCGLPMSG